MNPKELPLSGYRDAFPTTAPVGSFPANQLGLYDLSGNAMEWCEDWFRPGEQRVLRGSSYDRGQREAFPSAKRTGDIQKAQNRSFGFRVVLAPAPQMRVVLDTNILVAALRTRTGGSFRLIEWMDLGRVQPVVSVPSMMEQEEVLKRPGLLPHLTSEDVDVFLDHLMACGVEQPVYFLWRPCLHDADDDMLVEVAFASGTPYIVTNNIRDFAPAVPLGIQALTPRQFLSLLPPP